MAERWLAAATFILLAAIHPARRPIHTVLQVTTYYIDAAHGDDTAAGTRPTAAWKTLARGARARLGPGDRLLLAGGQKLAGPLRLGAGCAGSANAPVVISSFGAGRAVIDGGAGDGIVLDGCAYVRVTDLNAQGCGRKSDSDGAGIQLVRTRSVTLDRIEVSGFRAAGVSTVGDADTRITRVYAHDNGFAGITTDGGYGDYPRARNLYIGHCIADNNPGDPKNLTNHSGNGIVVGGLDGGLIEYCEASNNGWDMPRDGNGPVGIWGWNCDRLTIQHCISHDNRSPGADGGGFDFDGGVTNSVLQYNLSYNNTGTGYLLCQYPGAPPWHGNVMRYNISFNDGSKNFHSGIGLWLGDQGISGAQIYNNTIVNPVHAVATLGDLPDMVYRNNVFLAGQEVLSGPFSKSRFERNLYFSRAGAEVYHDDATTYATIEEWSSATGQERNSGMLMGLWADPAIALPPPRAVLPVDPARLPGLRYFRPRQSSPCLRAGAVIAESGGQDFFGTPIPRDLSCDLGAAQARR